MVRNPLFRGQKSAISDQNCLNAKRYQMVGLRGSSQEKSAFLSPVHARGGNERLRMRLSGKYEPAHLSQMTKWVWRGFVPREITFAEGVFSSN